ncbi:MAG: SpoIIE family protein phosphatase, partial [Melioribacteraceae bacterium]|nr:SpoIIE family protein phosphatase [Melioribacteraceae bacterium]
FRKNIIIDSSLYNKSVSFTIDHFGASEIYLNGKLLSSYGKVDANPDSEKVYIPNDIPIVLNFGSDSTYLISVRYSNYKSISDPEWVDSWYGQHGFIIRLHEINSRIKNLIDNSKANFGINFAIGGIFFSLAILYFLLHLFYSRQKENLYYALFSFSLSLVFFTSLLTQLVHSKLIWLIIFKLLGITGISLAFLGYLGFIYSIFYKNIPKQIWFFLFGTVFLGLMLFSTPLRELMNYALPIYIFLATVEGLRAIIVALVKKKEHSWVIGAGVMVFVFLILTIFVINVFNIRPPEIAILILFLIGLFGLPSSMSVYLARSIASTNKKLEQQVVEIKELSEKELMSQQKHTELMLETEREKSAKNEAILQAKAAELQAKASEAEKRILEAENDRKTRELEEARSLQLSLLPRILPVVPNLEISVYMQTATEVGGDYYDFHYDPDGELTVLIGDATGHGLNAGTVVTATKSLFNSYASDPNIVETFNKMSSSLKQMNFRLLSMCLMLLKINGNNLRLSSAGMPPALVYRKNTDLVEEFLIRGMPLGTTNTFPYELRETNIEKGDTILLMSDGFPELFNDEKEMFGYKNVQEEFQKCGMKSTDEIIDYLKDKIKNWTSGILPNDDVTFVVLKVK